MGLTQLPQADEIIQQPTEPPTPYTGMLWLDTDEVAASPVGVLGYAQATANQTGITSVVDLTSLTTTVNVPSGHYIRITGFVFQFTRTAGTATYADLAIYEGGTRLTHRTIPVPNTYGGGSVSYVIAPSAGSHTYKLRASSDATVTLEAAADAPAFILVEDLGPTIPSSQSTGSLLASASLRHASVNTTVSTTSTTATEVDSTNLSVTFTAPSSGAVLVELSGFADVVANTYSAIWSIRNSSAADVALTDQYVVNTTQAATPNYRCKVTGLTPGTSYTWRWAWRVSAAGTTRLYHGPNYGTLLMTVNAA